MTGVQTCALPIYNEMIELNVFNEEEALKEYLDHYKADVVILDDGYFCQLKNNAATVYLTDEPVINEDKLCIFKYQKGEIIYKTILNVYASGTDKGLHKLIENGQEATRIHLFLSINGGAGASTVAKAYSIKLANEPEYNWQYHRYGLPTDRTANIFRSYIPP